MIIGDAPNNELIPFESRNGALIDKILKWLNTNRKQCYLTYLTKCNTKIAQHRKNCDWINKEIEIIKPKLIITFGEKSAKHLLKTKVGLDNVYGVVHNYTWGLVIPLPPIGAILRGKPEELREVFNNVRF
jgi:DNA polymerase